MKFTVSQTFETLGDPCAESFETREEAEAAAVAMRRDIAAMVAKWETPSERPTRKTGFTAELGAWNEALEIAGVAYDADTSTVTADSPMVYGIEAGEHIANLSVMIEE